MIVPYIIFGLTFSNIIFFNATFLNQVLAVKGPYIFLGISGSCCALLSFIWKPIAGRLSDEKGTKTMLFWCMFGGLVGNILNLFCGSLYSFFLIRLINASVSPCQTLIRTVIASADSENQAKNISRLGIITAVVGILSALMAGCLTEVPNATIYMNLIMIFNGLICIGLLKCLPTTKTPQKENDDFSPAQRAAQEIKTAINNLKTLSTSEVFGDLFLLKAFIGLSFATIDTNTVLIYATVGVSQKNVAFVYMGVCALNIISNIVQGNLNKKFYSNDFGFKKIFHASVILAGIYAVLAHVSHAWTFVLLSLGLTALKVQTDNSMMEVLLNKIGNKEKATILGCFDSVQSLVDLISPIVSSVALEISGKHCVFLVSASLMALTSVVSLKAKRLVIEKDKVK